MISKSTFHYTHNAEENFFLRINKDLEELNDGKWYLPHHLGRDKLNNMLKQICEITGIDCENRRIVNHSIRKRTAQKLNDEGIDTQSIMNITLHKSLASLNCYRSENEKQRLETAKLTLPGTKNNNNLKDDNVYIINSDISLNGSTDNDNSTNDTDTNAKDNISDDIGSEDNTTKYTDDNEDDAEFISSQFKKKTFK